MKDRQAKPKTPSQVSCNDVPIQDTYFHHSGAENADLLGSTSRQHPEPWCAAVHRHDWMRHVGHFRAAAGVALGDRYRQRAADGRRPALPHRHLPVHQSRAHPGHQSGALGSE